LFYLFWGVIYCVVLRFTYLAALHHGVFPDLLSLVATDQIHLVFIFIELNTAPLQNPYCSFGYNHDVGVENPLFWWIAAASTREMKWMAI
jgi:hypothetical protein